MIACMDCLLHKTPKLRILFPDVSLKLVNGPVPSHGNCLILYLVRNVIYIIYVHCQYIDLSNGGQKLVTTPLTL